MNEIIIDNSRYNKLIFDGHKYSLYDKDIDVIHGQKIINNNPTDIFTINILIGILHLSSKQIYTTKKSGIIKKEFTSFMCYLPKILVKTKITKLCPDRYAIVKIDKYKNGILECSILEYLNDDQYVNALLCHNWKKSIDKKFIDLNMIDLTPEREIVNDTDIYSIDPIGCKDIDDALSINIVKDNIILNIHIADVSSYISETSEFDKELQKRVQTIYLENRQINMIPSNLSINYMSLKESENKRAFSVIVTFDNEYNIKNIEFKKTIINVKKNLSYEEAENIIKTSIFESSLEKSLLLLYDLGKQLKNKYFLNSFQDHDEYDTHQMVAVFMILTNKLVAEKIKNYDPDNVLLRSQSENIEYKKYKSDTIQKKLIEKYTDSFFERAIYKKSINYSYHSGLDIEYYTHFTSPIRRYFDIIIHRQLWKVINSEKINNTTVDDLFFINHYVQYYKNITRHIKLLENCNKLDDITITTGYITNIRENIIRIYINILDIEYDYHIVNNKLKQLYDIVYLNDEIKIIKNDNITSLKMFQKLDLKIAKINSIHKIKVEISL